MINAKKRFEVLKRDWFKCQYCWRTGRDVSLEVDHIIPKALGGTDIIDNLVTCCRECNMWKGRNSLSSNFLRREKLKDLKKEIRELFYKTWNQNYLGTIDQRNINLFNYWVEKQIEINECYKSYLDCSKKVFDTNKFINRFEKNFYEILDYYFKTDLEYQDAIINKIKKDNIDYIMDLFNSILMDWWEENMGKEFKSYNIRLNYVLTDMIVDFNYYCYDWKNSWIRKNSLFRNMLKRYD